MRPSGFSHNIPNIRVRDAESLGYFSLRNAFRRKAANLPNIVLGNLGVAVGFAPSFSKHSHQMKAVFRLRAVFKVFKPVIVSYAVLVVYFQSFRLWAYKCLHNQQVGRMPAAVFAERVLGVSLKVKANPQDAPRNVSSAFLDVSEASLIGYLVFAFKPKNWLPSFHNSPIKG